MDNFDSSKPSPDEKPNAPIPFDDDLGDTNISHSPLDLGGSSTAEAPKVKAPAQMVKPIAKAKEAAGELVSSERISGVRTFFTKLHAGAIIFLDEQIAKWLKDNPSITIKRTNITTGDVQGKKTEPNVIITVWY